MDDLPGWGVDDAPNDGYASEGEIDTRKLVSNQLKKRKSKSGGFQSLGLNPSVLKGILKKGYNVPTPIQRKTIPILLEGKDVVAMARTGSGKTAAFLIPLFEKLRVHNSSSGARALILSPTRELALQTLKFTKELGRFLDLKAAVILGGDSIEGQFEVMHSKPDIIIATPGRFVHLCVEMELKLSNIEYIVFDEADRLFEMGFAEQLNDILSRVPDVRQTLLFSATLPKLLVEFARAGLTDPVLIRLDVESKLSENLKMAFIKCSPDDKLAALMFILRNIIKENQQSVIFAATKHHVEYLHMFLNLVGIENTYIYSSLDATARKINVAKFQSKKIRCLIVTDVAARGIDIPLLDNVINFNFPAKAKLFVHRVGRVARAGRSGCAFNLVAPDEEPYLLDLHLFLSESIRFAPETLNKDDLDWNKVYGKIPQTIVDNEADQINSVHKTNYDLVGLKKASENGYKQYKKSCTLPSSESIRRMKEEAWDRHIGNHPLFMEYLLKEENTFEVEEQRQDLLNKLKMLRPKTTVFEMSQSKKTKNDYIMPLKRIKDQQHIDNFYHKIDKRKEEKNKTNISKQKITNGKLEQSSEKEIESVFTIAKEEDTRHKKRKNKFSENNPNKKSKQDEMNENVKENDKNPLLKKSEKKNYQSNDFYIPYASKDLYTEKGYSIATSFEKEAHNAEIDLNGDENHNRPAQKAKIKWDRKKLKYVGDSGSTKKIKTESGVWIAASYKTDRYKKWIEKSKTKSLNGNEENEDQTSRFEGKKGKGLKTLRAQSIKKKHPLLKDVSTKHHKKGPKRELKTDDEIRKAAKLARSRKQNKNGRSKRLSKKGGFNKKK